MALGIRQGIVKLKFGNATLVGRAWPESRPGRRVMIRIRPEEVMLGIGDTGILSAQNILPGIVTQLLPAPEGVYVQVKAGMLIHSLVSERTVSSLSLTPGLALKVLFKMMAVEPLKARHPGLAVVLRGENGPIRHERMELLRQVLAKGSLSAAARNLEISYRTAWLWAKEINSAFEKPLLISTHGGTNGGSCVLSREARSWLRAAEAMEQGQASPA